MTLQGLSSTARRCKFPLTYTYLAGLDFDRRLWTTYAHNIISLIMRGATNPLLANDVRRNFDSVLSDLGEK